jgi:acetate---CoA ligase (ADP-forming)
VSALPVLHANLAQALFAPRSIALLGASSDATKHTARPLRFLRKHGYTGRIVPIHASRGEVLGERAWPSLAEAPGEIDHAFVMLRDESVEQALEECGARGIPVVTILSGGFADAGAKGAARQSRLVARARALGVRLLGPNSMGVIDIPGCVPLTVNAVLEMDALPAGTTSVVSHSGTMLGTMLSRGAPRGLGFAKLISVGNEADLGVGELVEMLAEDPATQVILLFLETVRDSAGLAAAARKAHAAGKPVVAYKLGRSCLGEALAYSHTGALAGSDAAVDAYFRDCGIVRVDLLETLIEIAPFVCGRSPPVLAHAARVAVLTTTGGGAASVVDRMGMHGLKTVAPDAALQERLAALGVESLTSPIIDLTMAATGQHYADVLEVLLESPACDAVLAVVGSSAQFHPQLAIEPILRSAKTAKPLAVFLTPHAERSLALLAERGIAAFRTPESCADGLAALFAWRVPRRMPDQTAMASRPDWPRELPRRGRLHEAQALALFSALGVPIVESAIARAPRYEHGLGYPVAAKILSPDIAHKTEAGGVALHITSRSEFDEQVRKLLVSVAVTQPAARIEGIIVQRMEVGLAEVIVGYRHDDMVGPLVLVGAGGTLAELYRDYALRLAPVSEDEAATMIQEVKGLATLRGYRNLPRGDVAALAKVVMAFSRLALVPGQPVAEAEINPLVVRSTGVVAVDGLVVVNDHHTSSHPGDTY